MQQSNDAIILDTEAAVMANFEFLGPTEMSDDDEISDDLEMVATDNEDTDVKIMAKRPKSGKDMLTEGKLRPRMNVTPTLFLTHLSLLICPPAPASLHVVFIQLLIVFCKASICILPFHYHCDRPSSPPHMLLLLSCFAIYVSFAFLFILLCDARYLIFA